MPDVSPIQKMRDDLRPARLMLHVHKLLECEDKIVTEGDLLNSVRAAVGAAHGEDLMLLHNERFTGLVRERAGLRASDLKTAMLAHLLRQAVVLTATALDGYLPALVEQHLPEVIRLSGRRFLASEADKQLRDDYLEALRFSVSDVIRAREPDGDAFITGKILAHIRFQYLAGLRGLSVTATLLGVSDALGQIARKLDREPKDLKDLLKKVFERRNDIVHRGDRPEKDPKGEPQPIAHYWSAQAVETISGVSEALDEIVLERMREMRGTAA